MSDLLRLAPVACVWLVAFAGPASAQSFLEQLFGISKPQHSAPLPPTLPQSRPFGHNQQPEKLEAAPVPSAGATYRTVCVRMCDGFFMPMSFATRRDNFQQDQAKCRATCGDDARLFVHRNPGEAIEDAVDLAGRPYGRLPNAFRFRKARVDGCACRPPPWSEAEVARHQAYAAAVTPMPTKPVPQSLAASTSLTPTQAAALAREARGTGTKSDPAPSIRARAEKLEKRARRVAEVSRKSQPAPQKPTKVAIAKTALPQASGSFSGGPIFGQGLTNKPKYAWPGD